MNFRGKCEPPAFSPVGIDDPNTGSAGFRAPDGCGHAPPVTRDSDVTPVERRLSSRTQIIAGPVVPFHLGTWITGLIYQDAIPGNREARREGRAVVNDILCDRKRLARQPEALRVERLGQKARPTNEQ